MSIQELNESVIPNASAELQSPTDAKPKKGGIFKLFKKTFTIFAWGFSIVVLLNLEPVTKTIDTISNLDTFLRYIRGEDKEFEKGLDHKYVRLKQSFSTMKTSSLKSWEFIKAKLQIPLDVMQSVFDELVLYGENIGEDLQAYIPAEEMTCAKDEP